VFDFIYIDILSGCDTYNVYSACFF